MDLQQQCHITVKCFSDKYQHLDAFHHLKPYML